MKLSELFYSIQGEGVTNGKPALFIRLYNCNLICGGPGGSLVGKKVEGAPCSWWCDTEASWRQYTEYTNEEVEQLIIEEGKKYDIPLIDWLIDGTVHFIWTGGEPMMEHSREAIVSFREYWDDFSHPGNTSYHEVETNGTIIATRYVSETLLQDQREPIDLMSGVNNCYLDFDQVNCSPKLANSGMKKEARIKPKALYQIKANKNHWWKFVINCESEEAALRDLEEIDSDYIRPYQLDRRRLVIMPGVDKLEDLPGVTRTLFEVAKRKGIYAVTRGHILAWDQTTGV